MITLNRNTSDLWKFLSDAWTQLEDKQLIEDLWDTIASGIDYSLDTMMDVQNSRVMEYMPPIINSGPETFTFIVSGIEDQDNVLVAENGGIFKYYLPYDNIISIPELVQEYQYVASGVDNTYTEDVDYTISGMNTLYWNTLPEWDQRYGAGVRVITVTAKDIYRINPVLTDVWAQALNLDINKFNAYNTFKLDTTEDKYKHFKYFVWALAYKRLQWPTIENIQHALSIARGLPFAYNGGDLHYTYSSGIYTATVGSDVYYIPSGVILQPDGTTVEQFEPLSTGLAVDDYYSEPDLISLFTNVLTKYRTVAIRTGASPHYVGHSEEFYDDYKKGVIPIQFFIKELDELTISSEVYYFNSTYLYMNEG